MNSMKHFLPGLFSVSIPTQYISHSDWQSELIYLNKSSVDKRGNIWCIIDKAAKTQTQNKLNVHTCTMYYIVLYSVTLYIHCIIVFTLYIHCIIVFTLMMQS